MDCHGPQHRDAVADADGTERATHRIQNGARLK